jgi:hypothetical protein
MNLLNGCKQLIVSPSGILCLVCLAVLTFLSLHNPSGGWVAAWVAYFGAIVPAMGYFEHKEQLAQIAATVTTTTTSANLPPNGQL